MRKEKKRELTLEQLEKRHKISYKIPYFVAVVEVCIAILYLIMWLLGYNYLVEMYLIIFLCIVIGIINGVLDINTRKQVEHKINQIKSNTIKKIAKEDTLKESVTIKDAKIISAILSSCIVKIVIDMKDETDFITSIQLNDNTWQSGVHISIENLVSILNEDAKTEMLDYLIKYVKIENLEEESMRVKIGGQGFCYYDAQVTDDDLLEMFDLKE